MEIIKSGVFWTAVQAISALVGIIYLVRYTRYTKQMMQTQVDIRRAEVAPVFTLSSLGGSDNMPSALQTGNQETVRNRNLHLRIRNIGKGPALRFKGWHGPVNPSFRLKDSELIPRRSGDEDGVSSSFEVLASESAEMVFQWFDTRSYWLCVLECEDTGGNRHQFQLIHIPEPAAIDPWLMVHKWS